MNSLMSETIQDQRKGKGIYPIRVRKEKRRVVASGVNVPQVDCHHYLHCVLREFHTINVVSFLWKDSLLKQLEHPICSHERIASSGAGRFVRSVEALIGENATLAGTFH